ncbi:MAG TPA: penicillin-binding transpeptidase domain-containing protein, partial [Candidatus Saccharimonadales bacterium]|nr:penicillin-binding transpeptidase domain-containing protein [Candidatus Saccharimonadales bacterium]
EVDPKDEVKSINKVISTAEQLQSDGKGFGYNCYSDAALTKKTQCYAASAIGDGAFLHLDEHVNGLASLARLGKYVPQTYILNITNASGKTILQWKQPKGKQVIKPDAAYIVDDMLSDPNATYLPGSYKFQHQPNGWHFAVKTGTTNDNYDGLMTSWSTKYASAAWVGYHTRNQALTAGSMEYVTEPITRGWMEGAHKDLPADNWKKPSDIKTLPAFVIRNHVGIGSVEPSPRMEIYPSWYQPKSGATSSQTIDMVSGKLATSCTPDSAKQTLYNTNTSSFSIDTFVDGGAKTNAITGTDDVHDCDDQMPQLTLTAGDNNSIQLVATQGTHPLIGKYHGNGAGTIVVKAGDKTLCTVTITSPDIFNGSCKYNISGNQPVQVTATLTDSVLYRDVKTGTIQPTDNGGGNNGDRPPSDKFCRKNPDDPRCAVGNGQ